MTRNPPTVRTGLDVLRDDGFAPLRGRRVGLVCHPASVDARLTHAADLLAGAPGVTLAALFGPEHGLHGQAQDLIAVDDPNATGLRGYSLYGDSFASLKPTAGQLRGLDALVIDLQDIGSRYYTFQATMLYCLEAAAESGLTVFVLDRPNPLGGLDETVEGPALRPGFESFVGPRSISTRHGLTMGELAHLYRTESNLSVDVRVIPCDGWRRGMWYEETGVTWVLPSPNMPTVETAVVYPGQCLIEGTNLSEGRGTTRPFELCGAPWIDPRALVKRLEREEHPGVTFRPTWFRPTFQKFAGQDCGGVQMHVTDRAAFRPVRAGLALLAALRELSGPHFRWRTEVYEFVDDKPAVDLLFGSDRERLGLDAGASAAELARSWEPEEAAFRDRRRPYLMYA